MTPPPLVDCELRTAFPASLEAIEQFFIEFRRRQPALLDRETCFAVELLLREALTNAVVHGCDTDPRKIVGCALRLKGRRLLIIVENAGNGFDWRDASRNTADVSDCSGRGLEILRRYADHVRFSERGNMVAIVKRLDC